MAKRNSKDERCFWWSYAIDADGGCVIVRADDRQGAHEEKERMKGSDARRVGTTCRKISEDTMRTNMTAMGYTLLVSR